MPRPKYLKLQVRAPASLANLGAGYDCLAVAVDLWNDYELWICMDDFTKEKKEFEISILNNPYYDVDPKMRSLDGNLFVRAFIYTRDYIYYRANLPAQQYNCAVFQNIHIPPIRGLGSSSSACVAGVASGLAYFEYMHPEINLATVGVDVSKEGVAQLARQVDNCPDNVCACVEGGLTMVFLEENKSADGWQRLHYFRMPLEDPDLRFVFLIPRSTIRTSDARKALIAQSYKIDDVVFNLTRSSCLPWIFSEKRYDLLKEATKDRIHQRQRAGLFSGKDDNKVNIEATLVEVVDRGAYAACVSGSGSALVAVAVARTAEMVANNFRRAFEKHASKACWEVEEICILRPTNQVLNVMRHGRISVPGVWVIKRSRCGREGVKRAGMPENDLRKPGDAQPVDTGRRQ